MVSPIEKCVWHDFVWRIVLGRDESCGDDNNDLGLYQLWHNGVKVYEQLAHQQFAIIATMVHVLNLECIVGSRRLEIVK